jgi:stage IV sporulation protein FB
VRLGRPRVRVHPLFLAVLALAVAAGLGREALVLCLVLAGHELAHLLVAAAFGLRLASAEVLPFGAVLRLEGLEAADPGVEVAVALAGPLQNLLWLSAGFALRAAGWLVPSVGGFFLLANAVVGAGNLLPALPLDGGRALRALLALHWGHARAGRVVAWAGYGVAAGLGALGVAALARGTLVPGAFVLAAAVALGAGPERRAASVRPWRELWARRAPGRRRLWPVRPLAVEADVRLRDLVAAFAPGAFHVVWVVLEGGRAVGPWDERAVWDALLARGAAARAQDLGRPPGGQRV